MKTRFLVYSTLAFTFFASGAPALASSSYEIRTNEEMKAIIAAALVKAGDDKAVESVVHDQNTGNYLVTIDSCVDTYIALRGSTESDGLTGVKVISSHCN